MIHFCVLSRLKQRVLVLSPGMKMAFDPQTQTKIDQAKVFMVGAGGIGCELLKNLLLTGFRDIHLIDLDTIEVSNLNRQFLFRSEHVGKPKAQIAALAAEEMCPEARITWYHESVIQPKFNVKFFGQFNLVLNALDNSAARSHVNRMCLAANVPLVESGSSGYLGNCKVIIKGTTECFDCQPPIGQKTYPGCTIRNTPSEPIHCIVWAKHLFNQLFGEADPDQDVSPDSEDPAADPEAGLLSNGTHQEHWSTVAETNETVIAHLAVQQNGAHQLQNGSNGNEAKKGTSTRAKAVACGYNSIDLFQKLFHQDISYLLSMSKLWEKRRRPEVLDVHSILKQKDEEKVWGSSSTEEHEDKRLWSLKQNVIVFMRAVKALKETMDKIETLVWDKDDENAMDFVTACANLRATCFGITTQSRYDTKQMAGNIIPAVASTNAIVAGLIIFNAVKVLQNRVDECRNLILKTFRDAVPATSPKRRVRITGVSKLLEPVKDCVSCSERVETSLRLNLETTTIKDFQDKILKGYFKMAQPDVSLDDSSGTVIIDSEFELNNKDKPLTACKILDGTRLKCSDFLQEYDITITVNHADDLPEDTLFESSKDANVVLAAMPSQAPDARTTPAQKRKSADDLAEASAEELKRFKRQEKEHLGFGHVNENGFPDQFLEILE
ncbi:hypothetical protein RvY_08846 [Ramazzottius varieornatus]|uniref:SUMO-activating enzyme subunit n=1 Tax=Ramazzottius varieornatus TaxID=947166 RepID=A0A1D1V796_RAMVA|nr:hypothetical protein RvY_08846 [Ramazzottius varieornatus]